MYAFARPWPTSTPAFALTSPDALAACWFRLKARDGLLLHSTLPDNVLAQWHWAERPLIGQCQSRKALNCHGHVVAKQTEQSTHPVLGRWGWGITREGDSTFAGRFYHICGCVHILIEDYGYERYRIKCSMNYVHILGRVCADYKQVEYALRRIQSLPNTSWPCQFLWFLYLPSRSPSLAAPVKAPLLTLMQNPPRQNLHSPPSCPPSYYALPPQTSPAWSHISARNPLSGPLSWAENQQPDYL